MDLPKNIFKEAIQSGSQQLGLWVSTSDTSVVELLAGCGYDWLMLDAEHTSLDCASVLPMLQAIAPYRSQAVVRPSQLDVAEIKKYLDLGAQTILVPNVQTAEEAKLAAASVAYAPNGIRGVSGLTRASRFGAVEKYVERAREEICLIVQVETAAALDRLEEIAAVDGVDAVFVGPADLAATMGHLGNPSHADVEAACIDAIKRLNAIGVPAGILSLDPAFLARAIDAGTIFTAVDVDLAIVRQGASEREKSWRQHIVARTLPMAENSA